ncbi:hypothetical protein OXT66_05755 [Lentilactobacillus senioris]|uniref:hypothetical protein n=1 Tax=Lentilactobacillus senioris TaxID=931534 RepID=UPI00227E006D|nr:hypothetical protein [Lentilactobacillus senioris]MCY9807054.1 hypothetical protein [Lentilactobacillus senioris]
MLKTYRKITTIQAEQFDGSLGMANKYDMHQNVVYETINDHFVANSLLPTLEGDMAVYKGDWIATGVNGERWAITDNIFKKTYVEVEERDNKVFYVRRDEVIKTEYVVMLNDKLYLETGTDNNFRFTPNINDARKYDSLKDGFRFLKKVKFGALPIAEKVGGKVYKLETTISEVEE